jgi:5-methylcytosine-specific restriction endonuclease McrA
VNNFEHTPEYKAVIISKRWRALRKRLLPKDNRCAHCGKCGYDLQLHHKTYERLGQELDSDVEFLCPICHGKADSKREKEGQLRSTAALYNARLNGWATKVYGEDWESHHDAENIEAEFNNWADGQDEE